MNKHAEKTIIITEKDYKKYPETYWMGKKVKLLQELHSGAHIFPVGMIMKITGKYNGFNLNATSICEHCGVGKYLGIRCVSPGDSRLELIEDK